MARIRTLKPEFWQDEKLAPLPPLPRLVFLGLISMADDAGRVIDSARAIDGFIFPLTDDTCADSLDILEGLERIERGVTTSGQRVIQIVGWSKHQRIDKPNMSAALPAIVVNNGSAKRRKIPDAIRDFVWSRDDGSCQACGREVRRNKVDRYDSGDDLGEIDHIVAVIDGGTNDPQNLQLLCLPCNRAKQGENTRRRFAEASTKDPGNVVEASAPRSVPTTNDLLPPTADPPEQAAGNGPADLEVDAYRLKVEIEAYAAEHDYGPRDRLIAVGEDITAWRTPAGTLVPHADRLRVLKLADAHMAEPKGKAHDRRSAIRYVIAQQYDPFTVAKAADRPPPQRQPQAQAVANAPTLPSVGDLERKRESAEQRYATWKAQITKQLEQEPEDVRAGLRIDAVAAIGELAFKAMPKAAHPRLIEAKVLELYGARMGNPQPQQAA